MNEISRAVMPDGTPIETPEEAYQRDLQLQKAAGDTEFWNWCAAVARQEGYDMATEPAGDQADITLDYERASLYVLDAYQQFCALREQGLL